MGEEKRQGMYDEQKGVCLLLYLEELKVGKNGFVQCMCFKERENGKFPVLDMVEYCLIIQPGNQGKGKRIYLASNPPNPILPFSSFPLSVHDFQIQTNPLWN